VGPWLGVLGLAAWTRWSWLVWLGFSSVTSLSVFLARPRRGRAQTVAGLVVLVGVVAGLVGNEMSRRVSQDFDAYWNTRNARAEIALDERLDRLLATKPCRRSAIGSTTDGDDRGRGLRPDR